MRSRSSPIWGFTERTRHIGFVSTGLDQRHERDALLLAYHAVAKQQTMLKAIFFLFIVLFGSMNKTETNRRYTMHTEAH